MGVDLQVPEFTWRGSLPDRTDNFETPSRRRHSSCGSAVDQSADQERRGSNCSVDPDHPVRGNGVHQIRHMHLLPSLDHEVLIESLRTGETPRKPPTRAAVNAVNGFQRVGDLSRVIP